MKEPNGKDLMILLYELKADQEGCKIEYEFEFKGEIVKGVTGERKTRWKK